MEQILIAAKWSIIISVISIWIIVLIHYGVKKAKEMVDFFLKEEIKE